jgi:hypothetical protein
MTTARDLTRYCAVPHCDLNLAGWAHVPWDCNVPLPAPTLDADTIARLAEHRRPWVQGSARGCARPRSPGRSCPASWPATHANVSGCAT